MEGRRVWKLLAGTLATVRAPPLIHIKPNVKYFPCQNKIAVRIQTRNHFIKPLTNKEKNARNDIMLFTNKSNHEE
jgi:hypothetical protein